MFFIPSLRMGGAERVGSLLCNYWVKKGCDVTVITFDTANHDFFELSPHIKRETIGIYNSHKVNFLRVIVENIFRLIRLRQTILKHKPDYVISFMDVPNILALMACLGTRIPVVISERTYPPHFPRRTLHEFLRKFLYKKAYKLVCQTQEVAKWAAGFIPKEKITLIPNPLNLAFKGDAPQKILQDPPPCQKKILAVGRLSTQKGFDRLIAAYSITLQKHPDWSLTIVGEGEERQNLEQQIKELDLEKKVNLRGASKELQKHFKSSDIFVLSSRVEGFPNALLEAMSHNLPVISFDCKCGPSDIIRHKENGLLVKDGDITELANALCYLIEHPKERKQFAASSMGGLKKYSLPFIGEKWLDLFRGGA